ncbi:MAG: CoA transferase [Cohaesibacteraceae bacterium]|nr:CoA transferase [Cohaesibacteraceae bacterium]MBL4875853.1 CoA transferase [Cohaesibacteraceae bacterium]
MQPFSGIRVLDLTHVLAGPYCSYQLGLLGAEIIKIEAPCSPDITRQRGKSDDWNAARLGLTFQAQASNKKSLVLDLKHADGADLFRQLLNSADVLVENYRPGKLESLGFGYNQVREYVPEIIYCSLSGFGQSGPRSGVGAYDNVIQASSGIMDRSGGVKTAASFIDYSTGLAAAFAISSALYRRLRDNTGVYIDCSMLDVALTMQGAEICSELSGDQTYSERHEPGLGDYATANGQIMLGAFTFGQHRKFWNYFGNREFSDMQKWPEIWSAAPRMRKYLEQILLTKTAENWIRIFHSIDVPAERIETLSETLENPQLEHRRILQDVIHDDGRKVTVPAAAFEFSHDGPAAVSPPPRFGAHSKEILQEMGKTSTQIEDLLNRGVIA